jgi:hypothetical protein
MTKLERRQFNEALAAFTVALKHGGTGLDWSERASLFFIILERIKDRDRKAKAP